MFAGLNVWKDIFWGFYLEGTLHWRQFIQTNSHIYLFYSHGLKCYVFSALTEQFTGSRFKKRTDRQNCENPIYKNIVANYKREYELLKVSCCNPDWLRRILFSSDLLWRLHSAKQLVESYDLLKLFNCHFIPSFDLSCKSLTVGH